MNIILLYNAWVTTPQMFTEAEMYLSWAKHKAVADSCYANLKLVTLACPLLVRDVLENKNAVDLALR
jgi:hypothetical protein